MRRRARYVKRLASLVGLWHRFLMQKRKPDSREARLAEALRANLRRRKVACREDFQVVEKPPSSPKSDD